VVVIRLATWPVRATLPSVVLPSAKVTLPPGSGRLVAVAAATVAVRVTVLPCAAGAGLIVSVVVVPTAVTVMPLWVPVRVVVTVSVAVRDWVPAAPKEVEKECVPASAATKV
jgi:hypothetical protein